jgi:flagellar basal body-associated protein FliL
MSIDSMMSTKSIWIILGVVITATLAFWSIVIYVGEHFLSKFW